MAAIFEQEYKVVTDDIDGQGHANNIAYLKWLQDAAIAHSVEQGWSTAKYRQHGWSWVVRSHYIEYRRPVFLDDQLVIKTWVADMKKYSSLRKYEVRHRYTTKLVAKAETNWAFVEIDSAKLIPVPEVVSCDFLIWESAGMKA